LRPGTDDEALAVSRGSINDWNRIAAKLPGRTNKDCRKRWSKIPDHINKGVWSNAEDQRLKSGVKTFGYR
jgi:Myb-like DNA-binding domain